MAKANRLKNLMSSEEPTLATIVAQFLDDMQLLHRTPKTLQGYQKHLRPFVAWCASQGILYVSDLSVSVYKSYLRYLRKKIRWSELHDTGEKAITSGAIHNIQMNIRTFVKWTIEQQISTEILIPIAAVPVPKRVDEQIPTPFTDAELSTLFSHFSSNDPFAVRDKLIFLLFLDTGMRQGEVANLLLEHINMEDREIVIPISKNHRWRRIGIGVETLRQLNHYLKTIRPLCAEPGEQHVFVSSVGKPMRESFFQHLCDRYSKKLGIHIHSHRFRHTFAVNMLKSGIDIRSLQVLLGHRNIQTTMRYLQFTQADIIQRHHEHSLGDVWGKPPMPSGCRIKKAKRSPAAK